MHMKNAFFNVVSEPSKTRTKIRTPCWRVMQEIDSGVSAVLLLRPYMSHVIQTVAGIRIDMGWGCSFPEHEPG